MIFWIMLNLSAQEWTDNGIFMPIALLVAETITVIWEYLLLKLYLPLKNHNFDKNL